MYSYLWNLGVKYSENSESEIRAKFTENFKNILGKLWGRFLKSIRKFCEKLTKSWGLLSIYMKNLWEVFD